MKFVRISVSEVINLEAITRIETYRTQQISYITIHFTGGSSYRCTEEESEELLKHVRPLLPDQQ